jgi:O-antigen ligase
VAGPRWSLLLAGFPLLIALVAWSWKQPGAALVALALLIPIQARINLPGDWSLAIGFIAISGLAAVVVYREMALGAWCLVLGRGDGQPDRHQSYRPLSPSTKHQAPSTALFLLITSALASFWMAVELGEAARRTLYLGWFLLLFWVVPRCVRSPEAVYRVARAIPFATLVVAVIGLAQFAAQFWVGPLPLAAFWVERVTPILEGERVAASYGQVGTNWILWIGGQPILRAIGPFSGPPDAAQYLGVALPLAVALALYRKRLRAWDLAGLGLLSLFFALSFSRQAWVGVLAGLIGIALAAWPLPGARTLARRLGFFLSLGLVVGTTGLVWGSVQREGPLGAVVDRLRSIGDSSDTSNRDRLQTWAQALVIAEEHPILGTGLGNFGSATGERRGTYSHNTYLDFLVEVGPLGLLGLLLLLAWAGTSARRLARAGPTPELRAFGLGAFGSVIALAVIFFFDDAFFFPRAGQAFWLLLGLIAAAVSTQGAGAERS